MVIFLPNPDSDIDRKMSSEPDPEPITIQSCCCYLESIKKLKRFKFIEPYSFGLLGFFVAALFVICCFFYLDYSSVVKGFGVRSYSDKFAWLQVDNRSNNYPTTTVNRVDFFDAECDVFDGDWTWDENYPLYQSKDCNFLDSGFRCSENGRPDSFYTKWRWQPKACNLPRFDGKMMLEKLRNKRVAFIGDSIGRNQWESLLCMLSSVIPNKSSIYEVNGSPITKHKGFLVFKFQDFNCTLEYYRAPFLVLQSRPPAKTPVKMKSTLKLDKMDWSSRQWKNADVIVYNTGHWWNKDKIFKQSCYFQEGKKVKMNMSVDNAYRKSMNTVFDWTRKEVNLNRTQVFFRTFAPVHFRGGSWKNGGTCHLESLPDMSSSLVPPDTWTHFKIAAEVFSDGRNTSAAMNFRLLNITSMTSRRKDGHASLYYLGPHGPAPFHKQDCSHWCLPGIPDAWNELLYALFMKRAMSQTWSSSSQALA